MANTFLLSFGAFSIATPPSSSSSSFPSKHQRKNFVFKSHEKLFLSNFSSPLLPACILSCTHFVDKANGSSFFLLPSNGRGWGVNNVPCTFHLNELWTVADAPSTRIIGVCLSVNDVQWGRIRAHLINMNAQRRHYAAGWWRAPARERPNAIPIRVPASQRVWQVSRLGGREERIPINTRSFLGMWETTAGKSRTRLFSKLFFRFFFRFPFFISLASCSFLLRLAIHKEIKKENSVIFERAKFLQILAKARRPEMKRKFRKGSSGKEFIMIKPDITRRGSYRLSWIPREEEERN